MSSWEYDAAILLGGGINYDGSLAVDQKMQVEMAADLHFRGLAKHLITCGAYGYKDERRPVISEARGYASFAETLGVSSASIRSDERSLETSGNMYFAKMILLAYGWDRVAIIPAINHSSERVAYAATKILGPDYSWRMLRPHANLSVQHVERERRSLVTTKAIQDEITDGDHEMIYKRLCETHPAYGGTLYTLDELKTLLGTRSLQSSQYAIPA